jgi:hypothetical protein
MQGAGVMAAIVIMVLHQQGDFSSPNIVFPLTTAPGAKWGKNHQAQQSTCDDKEESLVKPSSLLPCLAP